MKKQRLEGIGKEMMSLEALNEIKGFLRKRVAEEVDIRFTPEIRVKLDNSMENAMKITKLLNDLKA